MSGVSIRSRDFPSLRTANGTVVVVLSGLRSKDILILPAALPKSLSFFRPRFAARKEDSNKNAEAIITTSDKKDGEAKDTTYMFFALQFEEDASTAEDQEEEGHYHRFFTLAAGRYPAAAVCGLQHADKVTSKQAMPNHSYKYSPTEPAGIQNGGPLVAPFYFSDLTTGMTRHPKHPIDNCKLARGNAIAAHKLLFALLQGTVPDLSNVAAEEIAFYMAEAIALAEFYGIAQIVAPQLSRIARTVQGFLNEIAAYPEFHMCLAAKLRDQAMFMEALRHLIVKNDVELPAEIGPAGWNHDKVCTMVNKYERQLHELSLRIQKLIRDSFEPNFDPVAAGIYWTQEAR